MTRKNDGCTDHCETGHKLQRWQILVAALSTAPMAAVCALVVGYFQPKPPPPERPPIVRDTTGTSGDPQLVNQVDPDDLDTTDVPLTGPHAEPTADVSDSPVLPELPQRRIVGPTIAMSPVPDSFVVHQYTPPEEVYARRAEDNLREEPFVADGHFIVPTRYGEPLEITGLVQQPGFFWYQVEVADERVAGKATQLYIRTDRTTVRLLKPQDDATRLALSN